MSKRLVASGIISAKANSAVTDWLMSRLLMLPALRKASAAAWRRRPHQDEDDRQSVGSATKLGQPAQVRCPERVGGSAMGFPTASLNRAPTRRRSQRGAGDRSSIVSRAPRARRRCSPGSPPRPGRTRSAISSKSRKPRRCEAGRRPRRAAAVDRELDADIHPAVGCSRISTARSPPTAAIMTFCWLPPLSQSMRRSRCGGGHRISATRRARFRVPGAAMSGAARRPVSAALG